MKPTKLVFCFALLLFAASGCGFDAIRPGTAADPLSGTWRGEWGPSPDRQTDVTVEFKWDGKELTGTVDPEGRAYKFTKASFESQTNVVKMELDGPNSRRETVHYLIDGKLSGETMSGTFDRGGEKGTFKIEKR